MIDNAKVKKMIIASVAYTDAVSTSNFNSMRVWGLQILDMSDAFGEIEYPISSIREFIESQYYLRYKEGSVTLETGTINHCLEFLGTSLSSIRRLGTFEKHDGYYSFSYNGHEYELISLLYGK